MKTLITKRGLSLKSWIIVGLSIVIALQYFFTPVIKPCPETIDFDTANFVKSLTINLKDTVYVPVLDSIKEKELRELKNEYKERNPKIKLIEITVPKIIDSAEVAREYYSTWMGSDTIVNDSNALIVVTDIISQNQIMQRRVFPKKFFPKVKIVTKIVYKPCVPKFGIKAGFGIGIRKIADIHYGLGISGKVRIITKKGKDYGVSYDFLNKYAEFSIYWTIR